MRWSRRDVLQGAVVCSVAAAGPGRAARAAPQPGLDVSFLSQRLGAIPERSAAIKIGVPVFAEAGAWVPVSVTADLPEVEAISLFVEKNNDPWAVTFRIAQPAKAEVRTQLHVERTSEIVAVVKARGSEKYFYANADVIVTSPDGCP